MLMRILLLSDGRKCTGSVDISIPKAAILGSLAILGLTAVTAWGAFIYGQQHAIADTGAGAKAELRVMLEAERREIADAKAEQQEVDPGGRTPEPVFKLEEKNIFKHGSVLYSDRIYFLRNDAEVYIFQIGRCRFKPISGIRVALNPKA